MPTPSGLGYDSSMAQMYAPLPEACYAVTIDARCQTVDLPENMATYGSDDVFFILDGYYVMTPSFESARIAIEEIVKRKPWLYGCLDVVAYTSSLAG